MWDSRTVHCNTPAPSALALGEGGPRPEVTEAERNLLIRQVAYVCMTPKQWASDEVLAQRQQAFVQNTSTSHWPHRFIIAGHGLPMQAKGDPDAIGAEQRALIGYPAQASQPTTVPGDAGDGGHGQEDGGCDSACMVM